MCNLMSVFSAVTSLWKLWQEIELFYGLNYETKQKKIFANETALICIQSNNPFHSCLFSNGQLQ